MHTTLTQLVRNGVTLSVDDEGGSGLPVVFQHGLCGNAGQTRAAFPNDFRFRRITLECRGHGLSDHGDANDYSIATFTDDLVAMIEELGVGPVVVGGISMGAALALRTAIIRPDLVKGLILVRPAWITAAAPSNMGPNALVGMLLARYPPEDAYVLFMRSDLAKRLSEVAPDNLKSLEGFFQREPVETTSALLASIAADGPGVDESALWALTTRTLVIGHEHDSIHPLSYARALAELIPCATLKVITAKAVSQDGYLSDLHAALIEFLKEYL